MQHQTHYNQDSVQDYYCLCTFSTNILPFSFPCTWTCYGLVDKHKAHIWKTEKPITNGKLFKSGPHSNSMQIVNYVLVVLQCLFLKQRRTHINVCDVLWSDLNSLLCTFRFLFSNQSKQQSFKEISTPSHLLSTQ